jgi:hypothetical protein
MSAAVSLPSLRASFPKRSKSARAQLRVAPVPMRPALIEAFDRKEGLAAIDAAGRVAVLVYEPTVSTVVSLIGILSLVQLAVVALMAMRVLPCVRLFAAPRVVVGTELDRVRVRYQQACALVYSGASSVPSIVRTARAWEATKVAR